MGKTFEGGMNQENRPHGLYFIPKNEHLECCILSYKRIRSRIIQ
jgi:hypothetical protein